MKILIGADSRAIFPRPHEGGDWTRLLHEVGNGAYEIETIRAEYNHWLFSIYLLEEHLNSVPDNTYDYIIVQSGFHESVCFWPEKVFQSIVGVHFNKDALKQPIDRPNMLALHPKFDPQSPKRIYMYDDIESAKKVFQTFQRKAKNVFFVGMHTLKPENGLSREYGLGDKHHYDVLAMNEKFSLLAADSLNMPMDPGWITENGYMNCSDGIHYDAKGSLFIAEYINRQIERDQKTFTSLMSSGSNNREFFKEACKRGTRIAKLTSEGDVVVLTRRTDQELLLEFVGCILYNRKPMVLQYPSSKVSSEEFEKKMEFVRDQIGPSLCLCDEDFQDTYQKYFLSHSKLSESETIDPVINCEPTDVAFLQMSSGTTGLPKILYVTHKELITNCDEYKRTIDMDRNSFVVSWLPLYHDMGLVAAFLLPLVCDAGLAVIDPFKWLEKPERFLEMISENAATHMWMPNFAFKYMAKKIDLNTLQTYDMSSVKKIISCSEPTYKDDLESFYHTFKQIGLQEGVITVCYALAENVFAVSQSDCVKETEHGGKKYVSCGKSLPGVSVIIVKDGRDVTGETEGMVYIKSSSQPATNKINDLFYGYYNTGDIGFIKDGELYIIDRQQDSFVTYGVNVYPSQVEQSISKLKHIKPGRVTCFGVRNEEKGTHEAYICAETEAGLEDYKDIKFAIMEKVKDSFDFSAKVYLKEVGFLVKTSSGKISRHQTREKLCKLEKF